MRNQTILCIVTLLPVVVTAQLISRDNKYILEQSNDKVTIHAVKSAWKKEIISDGNLVFTGDSKSLLYQNHDSLFILKLGKNVADEFLALTNSYMIPSAGSGMWLAYRPKGRDTELILHDLVTGREKNYDQVADFSFDRNGNTLLLKTNGNSDHDSSVSLQWVELGELMSENIWTGNGQVNMNNCVFDESGSQLAMLISQHKNGDLHHSIWYCKSGYPKAKLILDDISSGIMEGVKISDGQIALSGSGNKILFSLKEKEKPKRTEIGTDKIDVWSYTDAKLQSLQLKDTFPRIYAAVVDVNNGHILQIEHANEILLGGNPVIITPSPVQFNENYALICSFPEDVFAYDISTGRRDESYTMNEYDWNKKLISDVYLVSLKDGSRKLVKGLMKPTNENFPYFLMSPKGKYVVYFDPEKANYVSYETATGLSRVLSGDIKTEWIKGEQGEQARGSRGFFTMAGIIGWLNNDQAVLIQDHFGDIWEIDPMNRKIPICVSGGHGKKVYPEIPELIKTTISSWEHLGDVVVYGDELFFSDTDGVYRCSLKTRGDPLRILKSTANNFPKIGEKLTWKNLDGSISEGFLHKPDDFDPLKKYPIIFSYYEKPRFDGDDERYLKSGYLIFKPDIHYTIGETGSCVYNTVVSAAEYLAKMPYVDSARMGITGYSFGGYETNFLVTHTHIFAAAFSGAGVSDLFSHSGAEDKDDVGLNYLAFDEIGQDRMGVTPWERPDVYIRNSPIFYVGAVTTPVLLTQNKSDVRVPFEQNVEFFKALRRNGKRAWLLAGEGEHGQICKTIDSMQMQFFNHYLKDAPAPVWMTCGIPAIYKGTTYGMEFDSTMSTPGPGLLLGDGAKSPQQLELLKHKTMINDQGVVVPMPDSADFFTLDAKVKYWYKKYVDSAIWSDEMLNAFVERTEKYGLDTTGWNGIFNGNLIEYAILRHCNDQRILVEGLQWMQVIMIKWPSSGFFYPYAGLLYKVGRTTEGISWMEISLEMRKYEFSQGHSGSDVTKDETFISVSGMLNKMKNGESSKKIWHD